MAQPAIHATEGSLALVLLRLTLGALFVWVFFENWGKGLYTADGYAGLINFYVNESTAPMAWKSVMSFVARNAAVFAPIQAITEIALGVLLLLGLFTRPVALGAFVFLTTLWVSELGTAWIWELLVPMAVALSLAIGGAGRTWGVDGVLRQRLFAPQRGNAVARLGRLIT
jgi:uncharacterized membrane protein YphA (DoxX/SURF4 family)